MEQQEQESIWKIANDLAYRILIRRLSRDILARVPSQGEKIEIPHPDMGRGTSGTEGDRV